MNMETNVQTWIDELATNAKTQAVEKKKLEARDQALTQLRQAIAEKGPRLLECMKINVRRGDESQEVLDYKTRDQTKEFDWAEQQEGWTELTDEELVKHAEASRMIGELSHMLEAAEIEVGDPPEKVKLFDSKDLAAELYKPLVREGLCAETFVPDEFSETKQMIKGSFDAYKERLEEDGFSRGALLKSGLEFGMTLFGAGVTVAGSVMSFKEVAELKPEDVKWDKWATFKPGNEDTDFIAKLGKGDASSIIGVIDNGMQFFSDLAWEGTWDAKDKIAEVREGKEIGPVDRRMIMAPRIADQMVACVATAISGELSRWDLGVTASAVYKSNVIVKPIARAIHAKGDADDAPVTEEHAATIVSELAGGFGKLLDICDTAKGPVSRTAITNMTQAMLAVDKKALAKLLTAEDYVGAMSTIAKAAQTAVAAGTSDNAFCQLLAGQKNQISKTLGDQMAKDFTSQLDVIEETQKQEREAIKNATGKAQASLIEKKIQDLERKRAMLKWSTGLAGMGISVASKFFAPMAIAGSALSFAQNLMECVIRVRDALNFFESEVDMFRDASPYSAPVANFVHNAEVQMIHYEIQATCDLINMIGAIVETAGYASGPGAAIGVAVGKVLQATSSATAALEEVMYDIAKRVECKLGWEAYKTAILKPENRKVALIAMKKNPTLAKYAVAWGAIIEKDVLVSDFITKTGLNVESLRDPKANVNQVVKYLEARMPDDNVITGLETVAKNWAPAPQLTVECWAAAIRRGQEKAHMIVEDKDQGSIREIELAILGYQRHWPSIESAVKKKDVPADEAVSACLESLKSVENSLQKFRLMRKVPHTFKKDEVIEHAEMKEFTQSLVGLAQHRSKWIIDSKKKAWGQIEIEEDKDHDA
jgi:hypothetical protein